MVCLRDQKSKKNSYKNVKNFRSNDNGTYLTALKIGTNNIVKGDILNEKFLKGLKRELGHVNVIVFLFHRYSNIRELPFFKRIEILMFDTH